MSGNYLDPDDVGPEHAKQVLDFLNSAQSAQEIAQRVEIPGELDVGERVAARILARRAELGSFTSLRQIADIPLIGPERFTEIVVTLSGARPPIRIEPTIADLMAELSYLRAQIGAMEATFGAPSRVSIESLQPQPYLGEGINIVVQVTNAAGTQPVVDSPVTLVTTWGRLRAVDGTRLREGTSLVTRTDDVGMARALLYPPTTEELLPSQQAALQAALALLPKTGSPRDAETGLREVARQYRWHGNPELRGAIDIYFRDFGKGLLESVNSWDYLANWIFQEATVIAMVGGAGATEIGAPNSNGTQPNGNGAIPTLSVSRSSVEVSAALTLRVRNWLGAWLEVLQKIADEEARLANDLRAATSTQEAGALLSRVYLRLNDFVTEQRGVAGVYIGQRLAERTLRDFLETGIAELPTTLQREVLPSLQVASRTVTTAGTQVLAAVGQTRTELKKQIDSKKIDSGILDQLSGRITELDSRMASKVDLQNFESFRGDLRNQLAAKVDQQSFATFQQQIDTRFASKVDQTAFNSFQQQVDTRFATKVDQTVFADFRQQLEFDLGNRVTFEQFSGFEAQFTRELGRKVDQTTFVDFRNSVELDLGRKVDGVVFEGFRESTLAGLSGKLDQAVFNEFEAVIDRGGSLDSAAFAALRAEVTQSLDAKADRAELAGIRESVAAGMSGKVDRSEFADFQRATTADLGRKADVEAIAGLERNLAAGLQAKVDTAAFRDFQQDVGQIATRAAAAELADLRGALEGGLAAKADLETVAGFQQALAGKADQSVVAGLERGLAAKADVSAIAGIQQMLAAKADQSALAGIQQTLAAKADQSALAGVQQALEGKADRTRLTELEQSLERGLSSKVDAAEFTAFRSNVQSDLRGFVREDALAAFQTALEADVADRTDRALSSLQESLSSELARKADATAVTGLRRDLTQALDGKVDAATFAGFQQTISTDLARKADIAAVDGVRRDLGLAIEGFNLVLEDKADLSAIGELETRLSGQLAGKLDSSTFNGFQQTVSRELATRASASDLENVQRQLDGKVSSTQFVDFQQQVDGRLGQKADRTAVTALETRVTNVDGQVARLQTTSAQLDQRLSTINTSVARIDQTVTTLRRP